MVRASEAVSNDPVEAVDVVVTGALLVGVVAEDVFALLDCDAVPAFDEDGLAAAATKSTRGAAASTTGVVALVMMPDVSADVPVALGESGMPDAAASA